MLSRVLATLTRPNDTTQYTVADLIANSTTAGSVTPLTWNLSGPAKLEAVSIYHSKATATDSVFRLWLLSASPTVTNGDNGALAGLSGADIVGFADVTVDKVFADTWGMAHLSSGIWVPGTTYGLLEALDTYTPAANETFGVQLHTSWGD